MSDLNHERQHVFKAVIPYKHAERLFGDEQAELESRRESTPDREPVSVQQNMPTRPEFLQQCEAASAVLSSMRDDKVVDQNGNVVFTRGDSVAGYSWTVYTPNVQTLKEYRSTLCNYDRTNWEEWQNMYLYHEGWIYVIIKAYESGIADVFHVGPAVCKTPGLKSRILRDAGV
ncbi:MAG: hypothetical protein LBJ69_03045 [Holosporales bacterium]|jgi:hypothetical protein|nr:hypothetical protein [Holosporales bacterium]